MGLHGFVHAVIWCCDDTKDSSESWHGDNEEVIQKTAESSSCKAYTYKEPGGKFEYLLGKDWCRISIT